MELAFRGVELVSAFVNAIVYFGLIDLFCESKFRKKRLLLFSAMSIIPATVCLINYQYYLFSNTILVFLLIYMAILAVFIFEGKILEKFSLIYIIIMTKSIIDYVLLFLISLFYRFFNDLDFAVHIHNNSGGERTIYLLINIGVTIAIYFFVKKQMNIDVHDNIKFVFVYLLGGSLELMGILYSQRVFFIEWDRKLWFDLMSFISCIVLAGILLVIYSNSRKAKETEHIIKLRNNMLEINNNELRNLRRKNSHIYHDLKHHINAIYLYLENEKYVEAVDYITNIWEPIKSLDDNIWSGIEIIDLILNNKIAEAKTKGIDVDIDITPIDPGDILDSDLCSVISNFMDNAIEACEHIKNSSKWIKIAIGQKENLIIIKVHNSMLRKPILKNGKLVTSKENKELHGWGIEGAKMIVNKYHGDVDYHFSDTVFEVSAIAYK